MSSRIPDPLPNSERPPPAPSTNAKWLAMAYRILYPWCKS